MKKEKIKFTLKTEYSKLPNPWHFQQVLKGRKVHKDKSKIIPRKYKYKKEDI